MRYPGATLSAQPLWRTNAPLLDLDRKASKGDAVGTVAVTDVHEAKAQAEQARSQRVAALDDLESKHAALEAIIGPIPAALASLREGVIAPKPDPERIEPWMAQAKAENPSVRAAFAAVKAAQAEIYKAEFQRVPTIDLVASVGRNYSSGNIINPDNYGTNASDRQIGVQISMPILDGGGMPFHELRCPLMSLPLAFGTTLDTVPSTTPYLKADSERVNDWNARLGKSSRPRIGVVWSGRQYAPINSPRDMALEELMPLLELDADFISLQKEIPARDRYRYCRSRRLCPGHRLRRPNRHCLC